MKTEAGEWKGGVWYPKINNPKGFNRYNKNPIAIVKPLTNIEKFMDLTEEQQKQELFILGNQIWKESKKVRILKQRFTIFNKAYFGWDWKNDSEDE